MYRLYKRPYGQTIHKGGRVYKREVGKVMSGVGRGAYSRRLCKSDHGSTKRTKSK